MGWLAVIIVDPLIQGLTLHGFYWLIAGGMFYTFGVIFYVLDSQHRFSHGIWHLFVLAGSLSHFVTVAAFVA
jgi:hemolysin III